MTTARSAISLPPGVTPIGLSRAQAAVYVGVSPGTFDRAVAAGQLPRPIQISGRMVWSRAALDQVMAGTATPSPPPVDDPAAAWAHLDHARAPASY
jgi:predicted DNA-binding transcriptional regulator AlpA